jgi:hypothetical protein
MRKLGFVLGLILLVSVTTAAQDVPRLDVFGGYSYLSLDSGDPTGVIDRQNMHGWGASVTGNLNPWFGVEGDFSGHYKGNCFASGFGLGCSNFSFMAGPRIAVRRDWATGFVHALLGVDHASIELTGIGIPGITGNVTDNALAVGIGGGMDLRVNDWVSLRLFQVDYITTHHFENLLGVDRQHNIRAQAGVVLDLSFE